MKMDYNYIIALDYSGGRLVKIKLTESEKKQLSEFYKKSYDIERFMKESGFDSRYGFRIMDAAWMACNELDETEYNF